VLLATIVLIERIMDIWSSAHRFIKGYLSLFRFYKLCGRRAAKECAQITQKPAFRLMPSAILYRLAPSSAPTLSGPLDAAGCGSFRGTACPRDAREPANNTATVHLLPVEPRGWNAEHQAHLCCPHTLAANGGFGCWLNAARPCQSAASS
jgi:hypothetical protein